VFSSRNRELPITLVRGIMKFAKILFSHLIIFFVKKPLLFRVYFDCLFVFAENCVKNKRIKESHNLLNTMLVQFPFQILSVRLFLDSFGAILKNSSILKMYYCNAPRKNDFASHPAKGLAQFQRAHFVSLLGHCHLERELDM
jgi:hypothetical protein